MGTRLFVATTNDHKVEEIRAVLAPLGFDVVRPEGLPDVVEDGLTFADNARLKARAAAAHLGAPALADDSGLEIAALGGEPGVHSARYAGEGASDNDNNALLIERAEAAGLSDPVAAFVCHMTLAAPDGRLLAEAAGRVEGLLRWPAEGAAGFGYDPLFFHPPSGCRFAELAPEAKNAISHRGRALVRLAEILRDDGAIPADS